MTNDLAQISKKRRPGWLDQNEKPVEPFLPAGYFAGWPELFAQPRPVNVDLDFELNAAFELAENALGAEGRKRRQRAERMAGRSFAWHDEFSQRLTRWKTYLATKAALN